LPRDYRIMVARNSPIPTKETIDWPECPLVEVKPNVQGGTPVVRGTRLPVSAIVDNFDYGVTVAEIAEQFELPLAAVDAILACAKSLTRIP
jgi:uncharacterized protein (DUF433 family)